MRVIVEVAGLVLLGCLGGLGSYLLHAERPAMYLADEPLEEGEITVALLLERWGAGGVVWIDARLREKYEDSHIEGAILLNEQEWDNLLFDGAAEEILGAADKPMVVYCGSHACQASKKVAERMRNEMGVPEVHVLRGGWQALVDAGLTVAGNR